MFLMTETIQQLKEDIAILQEKLQKLEELEKTKTPVEECYKDWWGEYPGDANWTSDATRWQGFQAGYNAAYEEKVAQEPEENEWKSVALRFGEKLSGYLSDGYYELSPVDKPPTLYDICQEWCDDEDNPPVSDLIAAIEQWLPKEHDTNSYKWNECIGMIREKLR